MDKTAIQEISRLTAAELANKEGLGDKNAVVIPEGFKLQSLEPLQAAPDFFRGKFSTSVLEEFVSYVNLHGSIDSSIFIDHRDMSALSIIDMGNHTNPEWGKHRATIKLVKTPAYDRLLNLADSAIDQQDFIDFAEDWDDFITFVDGDGDALPFSQTIKTLRRLKVNANSQAEQTVSNYAASRSTLDQIEIKAGSEELPAGFIFKTIPYDGFDTVEFPCQLRAVNSDKAVRLKYRINHLEAIKELIANQFRDDLKSGITENGVSIFIGDMEYQK